jgi:hypothetical protein
VQFLLIFPLLAGADDADGRWTRALTLVIGSSTPAVGLETFFAGCVPLDAEVIEKGRGAPLGRPATCSLRRSAYLSMLAAASSTGGS